MTQPKWNSDSIETMQASVSDMVNSFIAKGGNVELTKPMPYTLKEIREIDGIPVNELDSYKVNFDSSEYPHLIKQNHVMPSVLYIPTKWAGLGGEREGLAYIDKERAMESILHKTWRLFWFMSMGTQAKNPSMALLQSL